MAGSLEFLCVHFAVRKSIPGTRIIRLPKNHHLGQPHLIFSCMDIKFCTLAASNPTLRWDLRHVELYIECLTNSLNDRNNSCVSTAVAHTTSPNGAPFVQAHLLVLPIRQLSNAGHHSLIPNAPISTLRTNPSSSAQPESFQVNNNSGFCPRPICEFLHAC